MFAVIGLVFAIGARSYSIGDGARMGPGYFPQLLGFVLFGLGLLILFFSFRSKAVGGDLIGKWAWKPLVLILGANLLFGVLLGGLPSIGVPAMGLIAAIYALTIVSSLAGDNFKISSVLILATVLAVGSYLAFIMLLKLQIQVWPTFITG
jgi:hypothetical protein